MKYFIDTHDRANGSFPTEELTEVRKTHAAINFPFDSITEVRRVTGADMRP